MKHLLWLLVFCLSCSPTKAPERASVLVPSAAAASGSKQAESFAAKLPSQTWLGVVLADSGFTYRDEPYDIVDPELTAHGSVAYASLVDPTTPTGEAHGYLVDYIILPGSKWEVSGQLACSGVGAYSNGPWQFFYVGELVWHGEHIGAGNSTGWHVDGNARNLTYKWKGAKLVVQELLPDGHQAAWHLYLPGGKEYSAGGSYFKVTP